MTQRGLITPKGELFAYIIGDQLYTLDGEHTGRLTQQHILDLANQPMWQRRGDAIYTLDGFETIGFLSEPRPTADNPIW